MNGKRFSRLMVVFCTLLMTTHALAEWGGPTTVLTGGWGTGDNEFDLSKGDSVVEYPRLTDVSSAGEMAISDQWNGRVKIYRADGSLKHLLVPPVPNPKLKTYVPQFIESAVVIPTSTYYFYTDAGVLVKEHVHAGGRYVFSGEFSGKWYLALKKDEKPLWLEFSSAGELLNTYTEKPLIMGRYRQNLTGYQDQKLQETVIEYPGLTWVRVGEDDGCVEYDYIRDAGGNVYCKSDQYIMRFNACGRLVSDFKLPDDDLVYGPYEGEGAEPVLHKINALYGKIVLGDDGSIYTSKSSDTSYQVLRWPWQSSANDRNDGPFAPWQLTAKAEGESVKLNWLLSPQDAGCVTGYEVARATTAGGPYTALTTVTKSIESYTDDTVQSGNTYYYAVRAISAIANSPYSNEAGAQAQ